MQRGFAQRGAVLPLVAICLAVLMGFAALAIDVGYLEYQQQVQQSATDAAALGGAQSAFTNTCGNPSAASSAAVTDAALNGYASAYVQATSPPSTGPYAGVACAVAVTITKTKPTFFMQVFGFNGMAESTQAVGVATQGSASPGCIWLLTTQQTSNLSNVNMQLPSCAIYINDSANMSNSTINASYIGYGLGQNNISNTSFTNATPAPMGQVSDPCPTFPGCKYLTNSPPPSANPNQYPSYSNGNTSLGSNGLSISGPYNDFSMTGTDTVCGLIIIAGDQLHLQGAHITSCSDGVTFAMSANTNDINFSTAQLNLSAPTSGNTADVLFWRPGAQANSVNYSNCTCDLTGVLYYPTAQVDWSSASGTYALLVFGQANFSTSVGIGTPAPGYGSTSRASLGE
ncbi:MAG TPA: pilus assembly protein TadG-related protein [Candidatus Cybelea sp.]|nr:pilus assembly protein TadG-related protein [Candidatus Cybelea sp.]